MSWSNSKGSRNGLQTFNQWRTERNNRKPSAPVLNQSYIEFAARKRARPVGSQLKSGEITGLVEKALASGGPIAQGDAFEHLLVVCSDNFNIHMYHCIVAEPRRAGAPGRVVMLTERTLHTPNDLRSPPRTAEFCMKFTAYAAQFEGARIVMDEPAVSRYLTFDQANTLQWQDAHGGTMELCTGAYSQYGSNRTLGVILYREALASKQVQHPELKMLAEQAADVDLIKPYKGAFRPGLMEIVFNGPGLECDMEAMALAYIERGLSELGTFKRRCLL